MPLLAQTDVKMLWSQLNDQLSSVSNTNTSSNFSLIWTDVYTSNYYINDCFQMVFTLSPTESKTIDFTNIEYEKLGKTLIKSWSLLKIFSIKNNSSTDYINIGKSGVSNPILIVCSDMDIGPKGIFVYQDRLGYEITNSAKNIRIENNSSEDIEIDLCCGGVIDV